MKRFLHKKWLSIPVIVVLVLALTAGSVLAAFGFLSFTTAIFVDEPLSIEYNLQGQYGGDSAWHPLGDQDSLTIDGSAGDIFNIDLRINNRADSALTVNTIVTGGGGYFTLSGFPNGSIPKSDGVDVDSPEWGGTATIKINGDAPAPKTYNVTFTFERS